MFIVNYFKFDTKNITKWIENADFSINLKIKEFLYETFVKQYFNKQKEFNSIFPQFSLNLLLNRLIGDYNILNNEKEMNDSYNAEQRKFVYWDKENNKIELRAQKNNGTKNAIKRKPIDDIKIAIAYITTDKLSLYHTQNSIKHWRATQKYMLSNFIDSKNQYKLYDQIKEFINKAIELFNASLAVQLKNKLAKLYDINLDDIDIF
jgi:hypothetical protein